MPRHQIFLVHGMGEFEPGWSDGIVQQLGGLFDSYPVLKEEGWREFFEFKELRYDQVFEAWRQQWRDDAASVAGTLTQLKLDSGAARHLVDAARAPTGNSFWQTHVLDVVGYRYMLAVAQEVWRELQTQMLAHLQSFPSLPDYSVIAHSLGSAVAYEALHAMISATPSLPSGQRPVHFLAVSNTARLLWNRTADVYDKKVGPSVTDHQGLCNHFMNLRHELDPVCQVQSFHPPAPRWFSEPSTAERVYTDVLLPAADISSQQPNIHSMEHYLSHPLVHVPLLRRLAGADSVISTRQANQALDEWREGRLLDQKAATWQQQLKNLAAGESTGFASELRMLIGLRELLASLPGRKADGES